MPVSSRTSRRAASSPDSSGSTKPPGRSSIPRSGSCLRTPKGILPWYSMITAAAAAIFRNSTNPQSAQVKFLGVGQERFRPPHLGQCTIVWLITGDIGFLGSGGRQAPLGDVLHATPGRLHHLVMGAGAFVDKSVAEDDRTVIGKLGRLKTAQLSNEPDTSSPIPPDDTITWRCAAPCPPDPAHGSENGTPEIAAGQTRGSPAGTTPR